LRDSASVVSPIGFTTGTGDFRRIGLAFCEFGSPETGHRIAKARHWRAFLQVSGTITPSSGMPGWRRSTDRTRLHANSLLTGNFTENFAILRLPEPISWLETTALQRLLAQFPKQINRESFSRNREEISWIRELFSNIGHIDMLGRVFTRNNFAYCVGCCRAEPLRTTFHGNRAGVDVRCSPESGRGSERAGCPCALTALWKRAPGGRESARRQY
jgi:hypothetical protein